MISLLQQGKWGALGPVGSGGDGTAEFPSAWGQEMWPGALGGEATENEIAAESVG